MEFADIFILILLGLWSIWQMIIYINELKEIKKENKK